MKETDTKDTSKVEGHYSERRERNKESTIQDIPSTNFIKAINETPKDEKEQPSNQKSVEGNATSETSSVTTQKKKIDTSKSSDSVSLMTGHINNQMKTPIDLTKGTNMSNYKLEPLLEKQLEKIAINEGQGFQNDSQENSLYFMSTNNDNNLFLLYKLQQDEELVLDYENNGGHVWSIQKKKQIRKEEDKKDIPDIRKEEEKK